ncbi:hypothetical protein BLNAU_11299 [Blattamonas nauphoetae]|uniref:Uncharacterized protein n=1 Tax=Blattamonas nauphoetae TaxID=2049346 RepID=A0ABQ9XS77_9EUKA|nr:hypothetical protein BLNAU_11299 [Blattamonas nauphoetae]
MLDLRVTPNQHHSSDPPLLGASPRFSAALLEHTLSRFLAAVCEFEQRIVRTDTRPTPLHRRIRQTHPILVSLVHPPVDDTLCRQSPHPRRVGARDDCGLPQPAIDHSFFVSPLHRPRPHRVSVEACSSPLSDRSSSHFVCLLRCSHEVRRDSAVADRQCGIGHFAGDTQVLHPILEWI